MEIQPQIVDLSGLFQGRLFRIPQYQRAYSWQPKHRQALFNDIVHSHETGGGRTHFMATVVGLRRHSLTIVTNQYHVVDIVDGQQRITTLVLLYKAVAKTLDRTVELERNVAEDIEKVLVKSDDVSLVLLQSNHDSSGHFSNYLRTGEFPRPSTAMTLAEKSILLAMVECEEFVKKWQDRGLSLIDLVTHLKIKLKFILHEISDESLVYTVFEVLNSRGLDVSWFDRLKSMLMAKVFEANTGNQNETINEVHNLWSSIYGTIGLRLGLSTEALRFAASLQTGKPPGKLLNEEIAVEQLCINSQNTSAGVIDVTTWIKSVTEKVDALTADHRKNAVTKVIHARLVAVSIMLRSDLTADQRNRALQRWENVTFRIFGMCGKDARTGVGDYVGFAWRITNEKFNIQKNHEGTV